MAAGRPERRKSRRDMWDDESFEDINSHSDGEPPQQRPLPGAGRKRARPVPQDAGRRKDRASTRERASARERTSARERAGRKPSSQREARGRRPASERGGAREREPVSRQAGDAPRSRTRPEPQPRKRRRPMGLFQRRLLMILALLVMLAGTAFLAESLLLRVTHVRVTGDAVYPEEEILAICGYEEGDNLLLIPIGDRERELEQKLPYVAQAKISRRIPGTVVVEITAAQPVCCLQAGGGWFVIGAGGKVLEVRADAPQGLMQVIGLNPYAAQPGLMLGLDDEEQAKAFQTVREVIAELGAAQDFTRLDLSDLDHIRLWYQDRVECVLGSAVDLEHKIQYGYGLFDTENEDAIQPDQTGRLDLSYLTESKRAFFDPSAPPDGVQAPAVPTPTPAPSPTPEPEEGTEDQSQPEDAGGDGDEGTEDTGWPEEWEDETGDGGWTEGGEDEAYTGEEEEW